MLNVKMRMGLLLAAICAAFLLTGCGHSEDEWQAAQRDIEFALSQRPEGIVVERASVELLSPVPRPESIREFMVFEQHVINCTRRFGMPRWAASLDRAVEKTFGFGNSA